MLNIDNLSVKLKKTIPIIENINFYLKKGETIAIAGESGSGKTVLANAILGILHKNLSISSGSIFLENTNLIELNKLNRRKILGKEITFIVQSPMTALDPLVKIGKQLEESIKIHYKKKSKTEILNIIKELLLEVNLTEQVLNKYPHQLSGGMLQRIIIAIAIVNKPKLIIADEPTTALDVTIQLEILNLLKSIQKKYGISLIFISHDLNVVEYMADELLIIYGGQIIESGRCKEILNEPYHPYTKELIDCEPKGNYKDKKLAEISGTQISIEDKLNVTGCLYFNRCKKRMAQCEKKVENNNFNNRKVKCVLYGNIDENSKSN